MPKIACVAMVKNEARHIAEWLTYQFALGFDTVLLLDNLSTDATKEEAASLSATHDIRLLDWPLTHHHCQMQGYDFAAAHLESEFDWLAFFDTDEFLVLDDGLDLKTCLAGLRHAAAIAIPWAMFGSSGHIAMPAGRVVDNFLYRSRPGFGPNQHVKSIVRAAAMRRMESTHSCLINGIYQDLAGREPRWQQPGVLAGPPDYRIGKLHHYFTRSWDHWVEKLQRGYRDTQRPYSDFAIYDRNEVFDDSATRFLARALPQGR